MRIRVTAPVRFIPTNATINVGDSFTTLPTPAPELCPILGSAVVMAPKIGGGTVKTWLLAGSWLEIPP